MSSFEHALERIDAFVAQRMAALGTPGVTLAITDHERTLAVRCYGYADLAARTPLAPDTLLEIGSIGKLLTAITLLQEAEAGRLDLHQPVSATLPWFELPSSFAPVTPHHLLRHTAGIPAGPDDTPEARYQVWAMRELQAAAPPGARPHYSNLGYKVLGLLLEQLSGRRYPELIAQRILGPLGMHASAAEITAAVRPRLAVGYQPLYDDRPWHPSRPLVPAPFVATATADGCSAATAGDLAALMRVLLGRGQAPEARLLSQASFAQLIDTDDHGGEGSAFGYGLTVERRAGRTILSRPGGMPGYTAFMRCDLDDRFGVIVLINGPGSPMAITLDALECLHALRHGQPLPALPPPADSTRVERAAEYAGSYALAVSRDAPADQPPALSLVAENDRLATERAGQRWALEPRGEDTFFTLDPTLDGFLLQFARDAAGRVAEVFHGLSWYTGAAYAGPASFAHPAEWAAYPGRYRAHNPWVPAVAVALRRGRLYLLWLSDYDGAGDDDEPLVPLADGSFRVGEDPGAPERVRFDTVLEGRALRLTLSDSAMYRV